jgi:uncharacterized membrane protein YkvA (DUF1232 family)
MTIASSPRWFDRLRCWAKDIKRDVYALYFAARDPRTPWYAKMLAITVAAYALSPIDLIPDFIPVVGYLDDIILVPLGILLVVRLIPPDIMTEHRRTASMVDNRMTSRGGAAAIITIWVCGAAAILWFLVA